MSGSSFYTKEYDVSKSNDYNDVVSELVVTKKSNKQYSEIMRYLKNFKHCVFTNNFMPDPNKYEYVGIITESHTSALGMGRALVSGVSSSFGYEGRYQEKLNACTHYALGKLIRQAVLITEGKQVGGFQITNVNLSNMKKNNHKRNILSRQINNIKSGIGNASFEITQNVNNMRGGDSNNFLIAGAEVNSESVGANVLASTATGSLYILKKSKSKSSNSELESLPRKKSTKKRKNSKGGRRKSLKNQRNRNF